MLDFFRKFMLLFTEEDFHEIILVIEATSCFIFELDCVDWM